MTVSLRPITTENWRDVVRLKTTEVQKDYVASNVYSIAQSKIEPECVPLAIYADESVVGFAMYALDQDDGNYWIYRLMIDAYHQGQGHGRAALRELVSLLREFPGCDKIMISVVPENEVAFELYRSEGFVETGQLVDDEVVLCLELGEA
jgi:diamine N-acetyltransferase